MKRTTWLVALLLVLLAGGCIRFRNLEAIPPGLYQDEAVKGTDAIRANETGEYRVFYTANNGREGLFITPRRSSPSAGQDQGLE